MDKEKVKLMAVTSVDIKNLEKFADRIFGQVGIDVEFTRHFLDRVNDERNGEPIVPAELTRLFKQEHKRWGKPIAQMGPDSEAVMRDLQTNINMPFALVWDNDNDELDLIAKTIMRKDNFTTPDKVFAVEDSPFRIAKRYEMPRKSVRAVVKESAVQIMSSEQMLAKLSKEMQGTHTGASDPSSDWSKYVLSHKGFTLKDIQVDKIPTAVKSDGMSQANIEKYKKADTTKFPPVVIGDNGYLLDGNHRLQAYKYQGIKTIKAYIGESTVVTEGATKRNPKEPGSYLMTHNDIEYKISRHLDDNDIHRGEWDIFSKGVSAFTGDEWQWVDTVTARWNAIARVKGLQESKEKNKIAFDWLEESRAYRTPRQLNGLKQSQLGEQLFEQLLALQILANSDPAYAARVAEDIMKLQSWPGFRTSQPDLYNIIAIIMKPGKFKDRVAQDVVITIPELRLKRNLRALAKRDFQNSDYSYMMLMLQRNMVDILPAPLIQMRRQISIWDRIAPRDKNVIRDRLMLQMRKSGLQNEFYEFLRRTKIFKRR
jgi:hypothetical protein